MTTQDQQIGFYACRHLHNDIPGVARAQDGGDLHALSLERRHVFVHFFDHEGIRPTQQILPMSGGDLSREIARVDGWGVIDTQNMEMVRGTLGQCRRNLAGGQCMGTVTIPILERGG